MCPMLIAQIHEVEACIIMSCVFLEAKNMYMYVLCEQGVMELMSVGR